MLSTFLQSSSRRHEMTTLTSWHHVLHTERNIFEIALVRVEQVDEGKTVTGWHAEPAKVGETWETCS